jgi:hypothetical protein
MAIEKRDTKPARQGLPLPAVIVIGALAIFGAVTAAQFALSWILGIVKFALVMVVVIGVGAWIITAKGRR